MIGRIEFEGNVVGTVVEITLADGNLLLEIAVQGPHPAFDGNHWRLYDPKGTLVAITREERTTLIVAACLGWTTLTLPLKIVMGASDSVDFIGRP